MLNFMNYVIELVGTTLIFGFAVAIGVSLAAAVFAVAAIVSAAYISRGDL
jgi:uncharacterized membrane protein (DUF485 family)